MIARTALDDRLIISCTPSPRNGQCRVTATWDGADLHCDELPPYSAYHRGNFAVATRRKLIDLLCNGSRLATPDYMAVFGYDAAADDEQQEAEHALLIGGKIVDAVKAMEAGTVEQFPEPIDVFDLIESKRELRRPVIGGLLRAGETMNVISASKVGKSWLQYLVSLHVVMGWTLFNRFECYGDRVLLIDNELHAETLAHRIRWVAEKLGISPQEIKGRWEVLSLRGQLLDLNGIARLLQRYDRGQFGLVCIDAWYRTLPEGVSENDNAQVAALYNLVDHEAERLDAAFSFVHHGSKGSQAGKEVTDVGAGAGSQSRAADSHVIMRRHEEQGAFVLEAAVRSWAPVDPLVLKWNYPLWELADGLDPAAIKGRGTPGEDRQSEKDREGINALVDALAAGPRSIRQLRGATGLSKDRTERLLDRLESKKQVAYTVETKRGNECRIYALKGDSDED